MVYNWLIIWLVVYLPLWKMMEFASWDDEIPNIWENKKCSKPPTRIFVPNLHINTGSYIFCYVMLFQNVGICLPMNFGWFGGQGKWILKIWLWPKLGTTKSDGYVIISIPIRIAMTEGYTPLSDPPRYVYVYMLIHMCEQVPKPRGLMPSFHIHGCNGLHYGRPAPS